MKSKSLFSSFTTDLTLGCQIILYFLGTFLLFLYFSDCVRRQWDFVVYYLASHAIWHGQNLYSPEILKTLSNSIPGAGYSGLPYLYTPFFARLLLPLQALPYFEAAYFWVVFKCLILEASLFTIMHLLWNKANLGGWLLLNLAACLFRPLSLDFNAGNVAVFEMGLLLATLFFWRSGRHALSTSLLLLCGMMKGLWLILILYAAHLRKWNYIKYFLLCSIVLILLIALEPMTWLNYFSFFRDPVWIALWDEQVQSIYNCSSTTFFLRTFNETYFAQPLIHAPWLSTLLIPLFPILIFLTLLKGIEKVRFTHISSELSNPILILLIVGILLLTPRLAGYTLSLTLYPVVGLIWLSWIKKRWIVLFFTLLGLFFLQMDLISWGFHPGRIQGVVHQLMVDKDFFAVFILFLAISVYIFGENQVENNSKIKNIN